MEFLLETLKLKKTSVFMQKKMENRRFVYVTHRKRNKIYHNFKMEIGYKTHLLEKIWHAFGRDNTFTSEDFLRVNTGRFSSKDEIAKQKQRLYLLKKNGWLKAKRMQAGKRHWNVYQFTPKAWKYKNDWHNFNNEKAPLIAKNRFLNPPKPEIIEKEKIVEKEIEKSKSDRFLGEA